MKQLTSEKEYNAFVEITPANDNRENTKAITFYTKQGESEIRKIAQLILDYEGASKLIIELQNNYWYPTK